MSASDLVDRHVGDPDAGPVVGDAGRQVHALAVAEPAQVPHRPVQHGVRRAPVRAGHRLGEEHDVLVGEQVEVGVQVGLVGEVHRPQPPPLPQVVRDRERQPRPERAVGDVGHEVQAEARHPRHARVLDAGVVRAALPARVGRQDDAPALDPDGHAVVEDHLGQADAGDVARATSRGSRCSAPSGVRPLAGLSTPSASSGSPGSGDMTTPTRVSRYGTVVEVGGVVLSGRCRSALHAGTDVGGDEVALEGDEQRHRRGGQDAGARRGSRRTGWPPGRRRW